MKKVLCIFLCLHVWTTKVKTVVAAVAEDGNLSIEDMEAKRQTLSDAIPSDRKVFVGDVFDRQEDTWEEDPPLFGQVCQISHGQVYQEPETNQRHLELEQDNPRIFPSGESDDERKSIIEDLSPAQDTVTSSGSTDVRIPTDNMKWETKKIVNVNDNNESIMEDLIPAQDSITSSTSMDLRIPTDNMKLQTKKSVNVNLSNIPSSDIPKSSTLPRVPANTESPKVLSPQVPQRSYDMQNYPSNFVSVPSSPQQPIVVPASTQLQYNSWQYAPATTPIPKQRTQRLAPPVTAPPKPRPVKQRKVVVLPSKSPRKKIEVRRKVEKRAVSPCQRTSRKPKCSKPQKRLLCEEVETERRSVKPKPSKRQVCERKRKLRKRKVRMDAPSPQKCPCNECPSVERKSRRKEKKTRERKNVGVCYLATGSSKEQDRYM